MVKFEFVFFSENILINNQLKSLIRTRHSIRSDIIEDPGSFIWRTGLLQNANCQGNKINDQFIM